MTELSELRRMVIGELFAAGFEMEGGRLVRPEGDDKPAIRALHNAQRNHALARAADFVMSWEDQLLEKFADGADVVPEAIDPEVVPVQSHEEAALFRFASLHWAVPVSQGYGRRTRFLVRDRFNGKLIGIFALGDPVFNLRVRDQLIGWNHEQRQQRLYNVFDGFILGAVDPYRQLIGGKMMALCCVSDETVDLLELKYAGTTTQILRQEKIPRPVLVTTTSALGKSSIYNRIKFGDRRVYRSIGFTEGFGHFQFSEPLFAELVKFARSDNPRSNRFGDGPNWKIRIIRSALEKLGLSGDLLKHGVRREVFVAPLSIGWRAFLRGETDTIRPIGYPLAELVTFYRQRWAIPRSVRRPEYSEWSREQMRLSQHLPTVQARAQTF